MYENNILIYVKNQLNHITVYSTAGDALEFKLCVGAKIYKQENKKIILIICDTPNNTITSGVLAA